MFLTERPICRIFSQKLEKKTFIQVERTKVGKNQKENNCRDQNLPLAPEAQISVNAYCL